MEAPKRYQLTPKAHGVDMSTAGYAARLMRVGPKLTTQKVLAPTGSNRADIEAIELNGGFAASGSAVLPMLGLQDDDELVNTRGSAIACDHPLDVSFPPLATTAINRLHNTGGGYCALFTICIDVGHDFAVALK